MRPASDCVQQGILRSLPEGLALCVAFSGGRDSTVLLHALARLRDERRFDLRALHVNHGIQPAASEWAEHCVATAGRLAVACRVIPVHVRNDRGRGLEAEARAARYHAFRQVLQPGEWLLTAHHADDQLETVLLNLLRGSGVSGLAGIPRNAPFGPGRLCRPLLEVASGALAAYAAEILAPAGLGWLTDPMNADTGYDRSYVRHRVTPVLRERFPAVASASGRTAILATEAAGLLDELARMDVLAAVAGTRLSVPVLVTLSPARQCNLIRYLVRERGWTTPPERRLRAGLPQLLDAAPGRQPVLAWDGHEIRRFRGCLYLLEHAMPAPDPLAAPLRWPAGERLELGGVRGTLGLQQHAGGTALRPEAVAGGLEVMFRSGGERVRPGADRHHRTLKYLFQSHAIVPWMRGHVPLVFSGGNLAAVADLWVADWASTPPGVAGVHIVWSGHAPIR